jgi:FkbM family methyltransferase
MGRLTNITNYLRRYGPAKGGWEYLRLRLAHKGSFLSAVPPGGSGALVLTAGTVDIGIWDEVFINEDWNVSAYLPADRSPVVVDAGANIGLTAAYLAEAYPGARIFAIEPEEENFERLVSNTRRHPAIVPLRGALWHCANTLSLEGGESSVSFRCVESSVNAQVQVQGFSIPDLMARYALAEIDFLKMDVEGAELEIFMADTSWLPSVRVIGIEFHERKAPGCIRAFEKATAATHRCVGSRGWNHFYVRIENGFSP